MSYAKKNITSITNEQKQLLSSCLSAILQEKPSPSQQNPKQNPKPEENATKPAPITNKLPNPANSNENIADFHEKPRKNPKNLEENPRNNDPSAYTAFLKRNPGEIATKSPEIPRIPQQNARKSLDFSDLGFLQEKNEWAAINKYGLYKEFQEKIAKTNEKIAKKQQFAEVLGEQIAEKHAQKQKKLQEDQEYLDFLREKLRNSQAKEREIQEIKQQSKKIEKILREKEMKANFLKKKAAKEQKKLLESSLFLHIPAEIEAELESKARKKQTERLISQQYFEQSWEKRQKKLENRAFEKRENQQFQRDFAKELDFREEQRQELMKSHENDVIKKAQIANSYDKAALEPTKYSRILEGFAKSQQRAERLRTEEVLEAETQRFLNKNTLKSTLEQQIIEKKQRESHERRAFTEELLDLQRKDRENLEEKARKIAEARKNAKKQWALDLQRQISEKNAQKREFKDKMSEQESLLNRKVLDEMQKLRVCV